MAHFPTALLAFICFETTTFIRVTFFSTFYTDLGHPAFAETTNSMIRKTLRQLLPLGALTIRSFTSILGFRGTVFTSQPTPLLIVLIPEVLRIKTLVPAFASTVLACICLLSDFRFWAVEFLLTLLADQYPGIVSMMAQHMCIEATLYFGFLADRAGVLLRLRECVAFATEVGIPLHFGRVLEILSAFRTAARSASVAAPHGGLEQLLIGAFEVRARLLCATHGAI